MYLHLLILTIILSNWLYSSVAIYSNNFVHFCFGVDWELYSQSDQFLVARAISVHGTNATTYIKISPIKY